MTPDNPTSQNQPTPEKILQTGLAFWPAKTLLSAIELGVFTVSYTHLTLPTILRV